MSQASFAVAAAIKRVEVLCPYQAVNNIFANYLEDLLLLDNHFRQIQKIINFHY